MRISFAIPGLSALIRAVHSYRHPSLEREVFGLKFPNPVGLAAGFDKDAILHEQWRNLGFGFAEMGTVTPLPQPGNPRVRLFRLPADKAILNRMGFNNAGVAEMAERLKNGRKGKLIIGGNIGKNKDTPNEDAVSDYVKGFEALFPWVDYFVVNVSSPNTPGLRALQEKEPLLHLLATLMDLNRRKPSPKPLLLKIAPDLNEAQLDDVLEIVTTSGIAGIVATNTTISREGLHTPAGKVQQMGAGGLSGAPLKEKSNEVIRYLVKKSGGKIPVVAAGGIMTAEDAKEKLEAGASLVQIYTGFIYDGPGFPRRICREIARSAIAR